MKYLLFLLILSSCATPLKSLECTKYIKVWTRQSIGDHQPFMLENMCIEWREM